MEMSRSMIMLVVLLAVVGALIVFLIREQFSGADFKHSLVGVWFNETLNVRILMYDVDSVFQGSIVWVDSRNNEFLGLRVIENLKVGFFNICKGTYVDPKTARVYDIRLHLKTSVLLKMVAYHHNSSNVAFVQEWQLIKS